MEGYTKKGVRPVRGYSKSFYIWAAATLLCMGAIFLFSSFDAEESSQKSSYLTNMMFGSVALESFVRKSAHFIVFAVLGFCAANTFKHRLSGKKLFLVSSGFASIYAVTDELHQYFVPGRSCQLSDWLIDTAGALFGVSAAFIVLYAYAKRRR